MIKRILKIVASVLVLVIILGGIFFYRADRHFQDRLARTHEAPSIEISAEVKAADLELGRRIVTIRNGCVDCHGNDLGGRLFLDDPAMGKYYSANITPYKLKQYSDEEIARAIRYGLGRSGQSLIFMPSYEYTGLSKEDLAATIAYLRSVPEVTAEPPRSEVGPMAKILFQQGKLPALLPAEVIGKSAEFASKPAERPTEEFGKYLVQTACVGCHGNELKGGPIPGGPPDWPEAANLRLGANPVWTEANFKKAMKEGISATTGQKLRAPMPLLLTAQLNDTELTAMWKFLSGLR